MYGVDSRDPTADRRLLEFCMRIPSDVFLRSGQRKALYFNAFGSRVPSEILNERRRGLQAADWKALMANSYGAIVKELEKQKLNELAGRMINTQSLMQLADQLQHAHKNEYDSYLKLHLKLSRGLSAGLFIRTTTIRQTSAIAQTNPLNAARANF